MRPSENRQRGVAILTRILAAYGLSQHRLDSRRMLERYIFNSIDF